VQRLGFHRPEKQPARVRLVIGILGDRFSSSDHGQDAVATNFALKHALDRVAAEDHPFTVHELFLWYQQPQQRLFARFCEDDIPAVCDLPTGMGKTNVIHIWLLARMRRESLRKKPHLPTRLVYVVDRRTVVDQATELAERIKVNCSSLGPPYGIAVSTLRGQSADNREWTRDPSRRACLPCQFRGRALTAL